MSRQELVRRIDLLEAISEGFGFDQFDYPDLRMSVLAMRGETDEAIEVGLESVFTDSVLLHLDWRAGMNLPHFAELAADSRVQEAILRWQNEKETQKAAVKDYLAGLSAAP